MIAKNAEGISELFDEYNGEPIVWKDDTDRVGAFALPVMQKGTRNYGVLLCFRSRKNMTFDIVAHEASHAAKYLFSHINASIDEHEPFEYVIGWIAKCCGKVKKDKTV